MATGATAGEILAALVSGVTQLGTGCMQQSPGSGGGREIAGESRMACEGEEENERNVGLLDCAVCVYTHTHTYIHIYICVCV